MSTFTTLSISSETNQVQPPPAIVPKTNDKPPVVAVPELPKHPGKSMMCREEMRESEEDYQWDKCKWKKKKMDSEKQIIKKIRLV